MCAAYLLAVAHTPRFASSHSSSFQEGERPLTVKRVSDALMFLQMFEVARAYPQKKLAPADLRLIAQQWSGGLPKLKEDLVNAAKVNSNVPVTVTCAVNSLPGYSYTPASGTITITLSQTFKGITTTGTGSAPVTCTGQPQSLAVTVVAPSGGGFRPGAAVVSASGSAYGTFDFRVGYCDASGQCFYNIA